jgi:aryl-alcohol dehydrogenase-like predicted oxidoreductase
MNKLGRTGVFVSELCLGTMTFGGGEAKRNQIGALTLDDAERLIGTAIDRGINFIDTADSYAEGQSEEITGQALRNLKTPRGDIIVATKVYSPTGPGPNARGSSRLHILDGVKASLRRLHLDHIDLYQIHGFDPATPIEETLRALDALVQQGWVRYLGVSNWAAWQIMKALGVSERLGLERFETLQAYYTLAGRDLERDAIPMLNSETMGLMVWSPLAGGLLSGKYASPSDDAVEGRRKVFHFPPVNGPRLDQCVAAMRPIAASKQASIAQVALAWLLHRKAVTSVIVGARRLDQLEDNIGATQLDLTESELDALDQVSALPDEYPGWMFRVQSARAAQLSQAGRPNAR